MNSVSELPFSGRIAVVTGGASGIGLSCVKLLSRRGAKVVVCDRDTRAAERVAEEYGALSMVFDVGDPDAIATAASRIEEMVGPVDFLVTSAGIIQPELSTPEDIDVDLWDKIFDIDLRGTFLCCVEFSKFMRRRERGSIVTIASVMGIRSGPLHAYGPAKAGVVHSTQTLAAEWGRSGIRVNSISPGYVLTPIIESAIQKGLRDTTLMSETSALGRMVMPDEIAETACFLLSDAASAITGTNLPVDNGWLCGVSWQTYGGVRPKR